MVGQQAGQPQQLCHRLLHRHAAGNVMLEALQVEGAQLLVVDVGKGVVGADLLHGVDIVPVGEALFGHNDVIKGPVGAAPAGQPQAVTTIVGDLAAAHDSLKTKEVKATLRYHVGITNSSFTDLHALRGVGSIGLVYLLCDLGFSIGDVVLEAVGLPPLLLLLIVIFFLFKFFL